MTRDEWLAAKRRAISSTESPALYGMSPYLTAYELAVAKQAGTDIDVSDNERIRWGVRLQDAIAQGIADDYGVKIEACEHEFKLHPQEPRMGASFDYRIVGIDERFETGALGSLYKFQGPGLLEIKNVDWLVYRNWPEHDAPDHIEIQVQHQMEVERVEWCVLAVLVGGNRTEVYTRMRDGEVGASLLQKIRVFWNNLEKGVLPPPVMPQDAGIVIQLHQYAEPGAVMSAEDDQELSGLCDEYVNAGEVAREATEAQKTIKAQILTRIGTSERALVRGYSVSASMVAEAEVKAYTRKAYRNFRVVRTKPND